MKIEHGHEMLLMRNKKNNLIKDFFVHKENALKKKKAQKKEVNGWAKALMRLPHLSATDFRFQKQGVGEGGVCM